MGIGRSQVFWQRVGVALLLAWSVLSVGFAQTALGANGEGIHRFYNPYNGGYYLASDESELQQLVKNGWTDEGVCFWADPNGDVSIYRLYNPYETVNTHLYTTDITEYNALQTLGWEGEGVAWKVPSSSSYPVHGLYDPSTATHIYSANPSVYNNPPSPWKDEGVAFYSAAATSDTLSGSGGGSSSNQDPPSSNQEPPSSDQNPPSSGQNPPSSNQEPSNPGATVSTVAVYRLYNQWSGEHLLTTDTNEYKRLQTLGWKGEGEKFKMLASGGVDIYRLYNPYNGDHLYTMSRAEYEANQRAGWKGEGVKLHGAHEGSNGAAPVYRLWNPYMTDNGGLGSHLLTTEKSEYDDLGFMGWRKEGEAFYATSNQASEPGGNDPSQDHGSIFDPSLTDTDGDLLPDEAEAECGTDPSNPDTDDDGMSDYIEVVCTGTDPLRKDDFGGDHDGDGLTDEDEVNVHNTNPNAKDTDYDGLNDKEEIRTYETSATDPDTDDDDLKDGFEVEHGLDPTKAKTNGVMPDADVPFDQEISNDGISPALRTEDNVAVPSLTGSVAGEMSDSVFLSSPDDRTLDENLAIVGEPVAIYEEDYQPGLTLSFDLSSYDGDVDKLVLYRLNDAGEYDEVPSSCKSHIISTELSAPGTYLLMDPTALLDSLGIHTDEYFDIEPAALDAQSEERKLAEVDEERVDALTSSAARAIASTVSGQADIAFVIDTTSSMDDAISNVIENVTAFATTLATDYDVQTNYALITYGDFTNSASEAARVVKNGSSDWFSGTEGFIESVRSIRTGGGGDSNECSLDALELARRLDWRVSSSKFIVLITDAGTKLSNGYGLTSIDEEASLLAQDGINASVISSTTFESAYAPVYNETGGLFANIYSDFTSTLLSLSDLIGKDTSNGEWIILEHGYRYIRLPKLPTGPNDPTDTDGDGLSDYEELGAAKNVDLTSLLKEAFARHGVSFDIYNGTTQITVYAAISDPSTADTDGDGITDDKDTLPWSMGIRSSTSSSSSKTSPWIGTLNLLSTNSGASLKIITNTGHAFMIFKSNVNMNVDFSGFNHGYSTTTGKWADAKNDTTLPSKYRVKRNESISMGANGTNDFGGSVSTYNVEFFKRFNKHFGYTYGNNAYIPKQITKADFEKLIAYFEDIADTKNYNSLFYNCVNVAIDGWDKLFGTKLGEEYNASVKIPGDLKRMIEDMSGSKSNLNLDDYIK